MLLAKTAVFRGLLRHITEKIQRRLVSAHYQRRCMTGSKVTQINLVSRYKRLHWWGTIWQNFNKLLHICVSKINTSCILSDKFKLNYRCIKEQELGNGEAEKNHTSYVLIDTSTSTLILLYLYKSWLICYLQVRCYIKKQATLTVDSQYNPKLLFVHETDVQITDLLSRPMLWWRLIPQFLTQTSFIANIFNRESTRITGDSKLNGWRAIIGSPNFCTRAICSQLARLSLHIGHFPVPIPPPPSVQYGGVRNQAEVPR